MVLAPSTFMDSFDNLWNTLTGTLAGWAESAAAWAPRLAVALVVGGLFIFLSRYVRRGAAKALSATSASRSVSSLIARMAQFAAIFVGMMIVLSILDLEGAVTSVLAGAGVVGLAVGFAFQDLASNVISGVGLSVRDLFRVDDVIETGDLIGVVKEIRLRTTKMLTFDGKTVIIPNKSIFQSPLINHSNTDRRRIAVECGVAYDTDLDHAKEIALGALRDIGIESEDPDVFFEGFGGSSIDFVARVWIDFQAQRDVKRTTDEMVRALKRAFDQAEIEIPFPIRTLELGGSAEELVGQMAEAA